MPRPDPVGKPLLTAEWRWLAMLNYEIDPSALGPFVPAGTQLESWNGRTFISVIGFLFHETRFRGLSVPFHRDFEEVNLRFYVRRDAEEGWRRAVVFIKELVPRSMIALTARLLYNENYVSAHMGHRLVERDPGTGSPSVSYWWRRGGEYGEVSLTAQGELAALEEGSREEFIVDHYWGYAKQRDGSTLEYRVEHPRWKVWPAVRAELHCDARALYGARFVDALTGPPASAFLAEGSPISVHAGTRLRV